ncbi:hypothetical protein QBC38DRAFT_376208 [Podospora fimiseda]|uniref:Uncharacterized protein n=1 Tax=Podospora fimiseda TaxID=252190 RepID=A0AAN6YSA6_9PEZI|nr:hypothetical protein QBC38DRAFT_376208 [Podospora fimiseda]
MSFLPEPLRMLVTNPRIGDMSSDGPLAYALRQKLTGNINLPKDLSLINKTILITGATSGVGLSSSRQLLHLGANLIIGARSLQRAKTLRADLLKSTPNGKVSIYELDMESLDSVDSFISHISADNDIRFDLVLLNAGIYSTKKTPADSQDATPHLLQVNFRATAYLALRLLPFIINKPEGRLVLVTSEAHAWATYTPPPGDSTKLLSSLPRTITAEEEYYTAKLFLALFGRELASRLENPTTILTTPGFCASGFFREGESALTKIIYATSARSCEQGAKLHLHALTCPDIKSGTYLRDGKEANLSKFAESDEGKLVQKRLWDEIVELVQNRGWNVEMN